MKKFLSALFLFALIMINNTYATEIPPTEPISPTQAVTQTPLDENIITDVQENIDESFYEDDSSEEIIMQSPTFSMSTSSKFIAGLSIILAIIGITLIVLAIIIIKKI